MGKVISVLPSEKSSDEAILKIKDSLEGLGEIVEGIREDPDLIVIHDPEGNLNDIETIISLHPGVKILLVTNKINGNRVRRDTLEIYGNKVSIVDCGNGGLRYEAEIVLDIMDAPEKYKSVL